MPKVTELGNGRAGKHSVYLTPKLVRLMTAVLCLPAGKADGKWRIRIL